ncbi:MAG: aspartate/glutamate racemase family protein [Candidatus Aminicenantales bacterium]
MRTIGFIGGITWESTLEYYRIMNEAVKRKLGGFHSARMILYSVDFYEIVRLQQLGDDKRLTEIMVRTSQKLEEAGADFIVIGANTMHRMADKIEKSVKIPILHIADATAEKIKKKGLRKVGLLGTKFTMEEEFYRRRLKERHGIETIIPAERDRETVNKIIFKELALGIFKESSRGKYVEIIKRLVDSGAEGVILGCTEIPLLVKQKHTEVPVFDTTEIHARAAVDFALKPNVPSSEKPEGV